MATQATLKAKTVDLKVGMNEERVLGVTGAPDEKVSSICPDTPEVRCVAWTYRSTGQWLRLIFQEGSPIALRNWFWLDSFGGNPDL